MEEIPPIVEASHKLLHATAAREGQIVPRNLMKH